MAFSKPRLGMALESDKEDEEISIDFSKIKNIFKRKKEGEKETKKEEAAETGKDDSKEEDEEIDIDFGRIKSIFKRKELDKKEIKKEDVVETSKDENEKEDEEINSDVSKIKSISKRKDKQPEEDKEESENVSEGKKKADEKEDDEDISLDFGKLKALFKKKEKTKEAKEEAKKAEEKGDDEEISLDFSKIKSFFKNKREDKKEKEEEKKETKDSEEPVDAIDIVGFYDNNKRMIVPLVIILFAVSLSVYLRVQPASLPMTDDWARNSVHTYFRSQIMEQINKQYPNLPEANKNVLVDAEFQKFLKEQSSTVDEQIKGTSAFFKSKLQDSKGYPYLGDIDTYFWWRYARNVIEQGHPWDELKDIKTNEICYKKTESCVPFDNHMLAPKGAYATPDQFHAYFEAFIYRIVALFNKDAALKDVIFFISAIPIALSIIPAFFIARRLGGNFAGAVAAITIAINPFILTRTAGGVADTDPHNIFFPLFIVWLYLESMESKSMVKKIILAASSGLFVGVYSFAWGGWWFIFDFMLAASIVYILYILTSRAKEFKREFKRYFVQPEIRTAFMIMVIFTVSSAFFVSVFRGFDTFHEVLESPFGFTQIKDVAVQRIWPNVMTTVAEQNEVALGGVVSNIGGKFLFFLSLIGVLFMIMDKGGRKAIKTGFLVVSVIWMYIILSIGLEDMITFVVLFSVPAMVGLILFMKEGHEKVNIKMAILLLIWYGSTLYAATKGIRWILLLVPAFSISLGVAIGKIYKYLSATAIKELGINKVIAKGVVIILLSLLFIGPWNSARSIAKQGIPMVNDAWWDSLEKIRLESKPDAIINSWWDFGHWFKTIADRAVTFDGTTQDSPQAYWIGNVLMTDDEDTAIGILKMLDCGANDAFDELDKFVNDTVYTIEILREVIVKDKDEAKKILLERNISGEDADLILTKTHCEPPEDYFIASEDMVSKSGVWAHFGSWDFNKAMIYFTLNKKEYNDNKEASVNYLKERFGYNDNDASNIYYEIQSLASSSEVNNWIAPWPSFGGSDSCEKKDDFNLICGNGIQIDLKNYDVFALNQNNEKMHPKAFAVPSKDGSLMIKQYNGSLLNLQNGRPLGIALIPEGESYRILVMDYALTGSIFTRLFYMDGHGLEHFKKFSDEESVFGNRIIVYKVDWKGSDKNVMDYFKELKEKELKAEEEKRAALINQSRTESSQSGNISEIAALPNESK